MQRTQIILPCVASREVKLGKVHNHSEEYLAVVWCGVLCLLVDNVTRGTGIS